MEHAVTSRELVVAAASLGGGVLAAILLRAVLSWLTKLVARTQWTGDDLAVAILREGLPPFAVVGGLWLAAQQIPFTSAVQGVVDRVLIAAVILVITLVGTGLAVRATRTYVLKRAGIAPSTTIFANVVRVVVLGVGILVLLQTAGASVTPLLGALGVGGLAVALALQDTLTNLFAGIHLLASRKIEPGDYISLSTGVSGVTGLEGYVVDVNWRNTTIRALANNMIVVPNSLLASQVVVNYHRPEREMSVVLQVGVAYDSDLERVERVTSEVATEVMKEVNGGIPENSPFIRYHTFGDSSIGFSVILRAKEYTDQYLITHEFVKRLHRRYRAEGIEIPFPIRTVITRPAATGDGRTSPPARRRREPSSGQDVP